MKILVDEKELKNIKWDIDKIRGYAEKYSKEPGLSTVFKFLERTQQSINEILEVKNENIS